jgi:hypothetical protein
LMPAAKGIYKSPPLLWPIGFVWSRTIPKRLAALKKLRLEDRAVVWSKARRASFVAVVIPPRRDIAPGLKND